MFFATPFVSAQISYNELVDTTELREADFHVMDAISTEELEFSPQFYNGGLVYVTPGRKTKNNIDKKIGEAFFELKIAYFDSLAQVDTIERFAPELHIKNHMGPCAFTEDQNTMFLSRNKKGVITIKDEEKDVNPSGIYIYKYKEGYWISDSELPVNDYGYKVFHPTWDEKNSRLIFASDMPGGFGGTDLYSMNFDGTNWIDLKNLGAGVNSDANEAFPFIYKSKYLFFASMRKGGFGNWDIYFSEEENNSFISPVNLGEKFNSKSDDFGLILADDPSFGFFTSNRPGGKGKDDIYKFSSSKSVFRIFNNYFTIKILDDKNSSPVGNAKITFSKYKLMPSKSPQIKKFKGIDKEIVYSIDPNSIEESLPVTSDKNGEYMLFFKDPSYIITVEKPGYAEYSGIIRNDNNKLKEILLKPEILDEFEFSFVDSHSNERLANVNIEIQEGDQGNITFDNNKYVVKLQRGDKMVFKVIKDGYISKDVEIEYGTTPAKFDIALDKKQQYVEHLPVKKGETMVLKDIYYDYNSYKLSSKAKKELDKLANHLKKNKNLKIELSSHTDSRGKKSYNLKLSKKRSAAAKNYLVKKGIEPSRIIAKGYGESKLRNNCKDGVKCSEKEHALNRRTEVKVIE